MPDFGEVAGQSAGQPKQASREQAPCPSPSVFWPDSHCPIWQLQSTNSLNAPVAKHKRPDTPFKLPKRSTAAFDLCLTLEIKFSVAESDEEINRGTRCHVQATYWSSVSPLRLQILPNEYEVMGSLWSSSTNLTYLSINAVLPSLNSRSKFRDVIFRLVSEWKLNPCHLQWSETNVSLNHQWPKM